MCLAVAIATCSAFVGATGREFLEAKESKQAPELTERLVEPAQEQTN